MNQRAFYFVGLAAIITALCFTFQIRRNAKPSIPNSAEASPHYPVQRESVGWVFGRLVGVPPSAYPGPGKTMPVQIDSIQRVQR